MTSLAHPYLSLGTVHLRRMRRWCLRVQNRYRTVAAKEGAMRDVEERLIGRVTHAGNFARKGKEDRSRCERVGSR